jgi:hypothetical protein
LPDRGGFLKRLHRPNLLGVCWIRFKERLGFQDHGGSTLIALSEGLMKPRKGFTTVTGKKNYGWGSIFKCLTKSSVLFILAVKQEVAARKQPVVARS